MTLTEQLTRRIQDVADVAGKAGREDEFTSRYSTLLGELAEAMRVMRALAVAQTLWLRGQAVQSVWFN